jgi:catechol 2,3-dioxygenase-like lactoylglutathione lyase family enzyme
MSALGKITGLAHVGYGDDNTYELIDFYCEKLGIEHRMSQEINHPDIGRINGVTGCPYVIGFVRAKNDEARLEFVGCVKALKGTAVYPFGVGGHMHIVYVTDDIEACRERLEKEGVNIVTPTSTIDYGRYRGMFAFFLRDINSVYVQIIGESSGKGMGKLIHMTGVSYTVTDMAQVSKSFAEGLELPVTDVDISGSRYLSELGGDYPLRGKEVELDKSMKVYIELLEAAKPNPRTDEIWVNSLGCLHLCVMVDDIDAVYARMTGKGLRFVGLPSPVELGVNKGARAIFSKISREIMVELFQGKPTVV